MPADPAIRRGLAALAALFGPYTLAATAASGLGLFGLVHQNVFAAVVAAATAALTLAAFRLPALRGLAEALGPWGLAAFHLWRIPAALVFYAWGAQGLLPATFVALAATGDLIAGLLAALVLVLPRRRWIVTAFHLFGMADFLVAVGTGIALTLRAVPEMAAITALPVSLIPLVGVPLSGATHLAALAQLLAPPRRAPA
ncbi:MAG: hypothetical protein N2Z62_14115 [Rhodobacteraceae bacterium]|nr:hypothetical protein [Paracoccaceae bacterium]